ncbi:MAG: ribosome maturation factor RimP [candidate division Zixibacteria bacterium]|nr:ribosome maturation factor RimP [candidate division Zixibacteria bacterium]
MFVSGEIHMEELVAKIEKGIKPLAEEAGLEIVETRLLGTGGSSILRVFVDRPEGVSVGECARLSRRISDFLDSEDIFLHRYTLEVSSPGLDRPLTSKADFNRKKGERIRLFLKDGEENQKETTGVIDSVENENLVLDSEGEKKKIPLERIEKALIEI